MTGILPMSVRYCTIPSMQETLLLRTNQLRPCVPRKDSISRMRSVKSSMTRMSRLSNRTVGTTCRRFYRADRLLTFYCCTKYRKFGKEGCSSHTIEARTVHEVVLADIQKHAGQALTDRKAMVTEIAERLNLQLSADKEQQKKELRQCKQRVSEIENLYAKLYEDLTRELLTEKRFQMLSARYDSEQEELTAKIKELEKSAIADKEQLSSIEQFAEQISDYAGITKLNFKIINQLIEKILVSEPVEVDGQKIQRLTIHYKFIGALETLE